MDGPRAASLCPAGLRFFAEDPTLRYHVRHPTSNFTLEPFQYLEHQPYVGNLYFDSVEPHTQDLLDRRLTLQCVALVEYAGPCKPWLDV